MYADGGDYTRPALVDGRCSVYDVRPMICRVWRLFEVKRG
jgi:Fe-S-cluster containining protein